MNSFIATNRKYFGFFYERVGVRIYTLLGLSFLTGLVDGIGLAMFLPLFHYLGGNAAQNVEAASYDILEPILGMLNAVGLDLTIETIILCMVVLFCCKGLFTFIENYYKMILRMRFIRRICLENISGLARHDYSRFVKQDIGRIQNTMSGNIHHVNSSFILYIQMVQQIILTVSYLVLALWTNLLFTLIVIGAGFAVGLSFFRFFRKSKILSESITTGKHFFHGLLVQFVQHFKYLKSTNQVKAYSAKLRKTFIGIENEKRKLIFQNSFILGIREPVVIIVVAIMIYAQVSWLNNSLAQIVLSLIFLQRSLNKLIGIPSSWNRFLGISGQLNNAIDFAKDLEKNRETYGSEPYKGIQRGITFENVTFAYDGIDVLKQVSLTIERNQMVALVGPSGAGKTTLVNMLVGLLRPCSGHLRVNETSIESLDLGQYREKIGYITQEPAIFDDTLFNNVTLWDPPTQGNVKRCSEALAKAALLEFVEGLPDKCETILGNNGMVLSGGQRQRVAIARELYKQVDVLLLDEATAALDSAAEKDIQSSLSGLKGTCTIIAVAHRLSTIKDSDVVVYMEKGAVVDKGGFDELCARNPKFQHLVELQKL